MYRLFVYAWCNITNLVYFIINKNITKNVIDDSK